jgi:hypothetical protein
MISPQNLEVWNNHLKGEKVREWGSFCIFARERRYFHPWTLQLMGLVQCGDMISMLRKNPKI